MRRRKAAALARSTACVQARQKVRNTIREKYHTAKDKYNAARSRVHQRIVATAPVPIYADVQPGQKATSWPLVLGIPFTLLLVVVIAFSNDIRAWWRNRKLKQRNGRWVRTPPIPCDPRRAYDSLSGCAQRTRGPACSVRLHMTSSCGWRWCDGQLIRKENALATSSCVCRCATAPSAASWSLCPPMTSARW